MHPISKLILSNKARILLNIAIWIFLLSTGWNNNNVYVPPSGVKTGWVFHLHFILYNLFFIAAVYINTLWLMPAYLFRRRYTVYIPALILLILLVTRLQSIYVVYLQHIYPGTVVMDFTSIAITLSDGDAWYANFFRTFPSVLLVTVFSGVWRLISQLLQVSRQNEHIRQQQIKAELDLLKSQINPHFLFNVLNSIYSLSLKKSEKTPAVVLQLSEILRYMLYETANSYVSLDKEIGVLKDYIDIEKIRINSGNSIMLTTDIKSYNYQVVPAVLITFVENAVKHGVDSMSTGAYVDITIKTEQQILYFACRNNYKKQLNRKTPGGIGLSNVQKRLKLLYPDKHTLQIEDANDIFSISLTLNLQS